MSVVDARSAGAVGEVDRIVAHRGTDGPPQTLAAA